jgi:hypothetical protein
MENFMEAKRQITPFLDWTLTILSWYHKSLCLVSPNPFSIMEYVWFCSGVGHLSTSVPCWPSSKYDFCTSTWCSVGKLVVSQVTSKSRTATFSTPLHSTLIRHESFQFVVCCCCSSSIKFGRYTSSFVLSCKRSETFKLHLCLEKGYNISIQSTHSQV